MVTKVTVSMHVCTYHGAYMIAINTLLEGLTTTVAATPSPVCDKQSEAIHVNIVHVSEGMKGMHVNFL